MSYFQPLSYEEQLNMCGNIGLTPLKGNDGYRRNSSLLGLPLQKVNIKGDGNCLFRAISYSVCGTEDQHAYFRSIIVSYIGSNQHGKKIVSHEQKRYIADSKMDENGTWGTDIEILGASSLFGVTIYVFSKYGSKDDWLIFKPVHGKLKVHGAIYLHHKNENHYDVVISVSQKDAKPDGTNVELVNLSGCETLNLQDQCDFKDQDVESSSTDLYNFDLLEFHAPISTSTPRKTLSKGIASKLKLKDNSYMDNEYDMLDQDVRIDNSSFEDALNSFKMPTPTLRRRKSGLHSKALQTTKEALMFNCSKECMRQLTDHDISRMRNKFWTKPFENRIEWFMDKVTECVDGLGKLKGMSFNVEGGKRVCGTCFRKLYRIDKNFYYKYIKKAEEGKHSAGVRNARSYSESRISANTWLDCYVFYHADRMPDTGFLMLPYKTRKIDIYNLYKNEMTDQFKYSVGKSLFYDIWNGKKNLKIKQTNSFSKCNTCVHLERELEHTRDTVSRTKLKSMVAVHNERQMNERRFYYEKKDKAMSQPKRFLSLIVDGMDQSKTNLPHFTGRLLKGVDQNSFLKTHIQGVLNHGCGSFRCYVDINEYSHDSNLVMNSLLRAIYDSQSKLQALPEVLFIQADNCGRENKNKYVMSFCELLVRLQIFREVHLSFLPVGHTHEDIDAKFSYIADLLRRNDTETLPALLHLLPNSVQTRGLYDIKQWLVPHINNIANHSKPLHFKFCKISDNISFQYKSSCRKCWTSSEQPLLNSLPRGFPNILIPPHFDKIITQSLTDNVLKHKYNMTDGQFWWWQRFTDEIQSIKASNSKLKEYAANEAVWLLPNLAEINIEGIPAQAATTKPHLTEMLDKELEDHQIVVSSKKVKKIQKKQKRTN